MSHRQWRRSSHVWTCYATTGRVSGYCGTLNNVDDVACTVCRSERPPRSSFTEAVEVGRQSTAIDLEEFLRREHARGEAMTIARVVRCDGDVVVISIGPDRGIGPDRVRNPLFMVIENSLIPCGADGAPL